MGPLWARAQEPVCTSPYKFWLKGSRYAIFCGAIAPLFLPVAIAQTVHEMILWVVLPWHFEQVVVQSSSLDTDVADDVAAQPLGHETDAADDADVALLQTRGDRPGSRVSVTFVGG